MVKLKCSILYLELCVSNYSSFFSWNRILLSLLLGYNFKGSPPCGNTFFSLPLTIKFHPCDTPRDMPRHIFLSQHFFFMYSGLARMCSRPHINGRKISHQNNFSIPTTSLRNHFTICWEKWKRNILRITKTTRRLTTEPYFPFLRLSIFAGILFGCIRVTYETSQKSPFFLPYLPKQSLGWLRAKIEASTLVQADD